jgi:hypothetical protein
MSEIKRTRILIKHLFINLSARIHTTIGLSHLLSSRYDKYSATKEKMMISRHVITYVIKLHKICSRPSGFFHLFLRYCLTYDQIFVLKSSLEKLPIKENA